MASMKLCKPSYGYGSTQNFSEFQRHEYEMKQSSHVAEHGWASKANQYSGYQNKLGLSMNSFDANEMGHDWAGNSTHCLAQAQSVLPSPAVHVLQENHAEKVKRQDTHKSQEWASNTGLGSYQAHTGYSDGVAMHNKDHMAGTIEQDWAVRSPIQNSSPVRQNQYGQSMFKDEGKGYNYGKTGVEGGWAGKNNGYSGSNQSGYSAQAMHKGQQQHGWVNKPAKYSSPTNMHHSSLAMEDEAHMMGKVDHGWVSSPTRANKSSLVMHRDDHMMGKMDHGFAMKPTKSASPIRANQYGQSMYKAHDEEAYMDNGWASKSIPNQYNNSHQNQFNHSSSQGHASYEHHDENIDDIMDEILTKYPAHNVNSNGYGNCATKSIAGPYVNAAQRQASFAKQQSMNWNERKEEYSSASSANKFEMKSMMNKEEMYNSGISSYGGGFHF